MDSSLLRHSKVFGLLCSFPLLEDLTPKTLFCENGTDEWEAPLTSPRLTGSLELHFVTEGIDHVARRLLDLPNGLNFTKIISGNVSGEALEPMSDLMSRCSGTVESFNLTDRLYGAFPSAAVLGRMHPLPLRLGYGKTASLTYPGPRNSKSRCSSAHFHLCDGSQ